MAELPPVVPGEPVDSATFGNPVIDRVLSRYLDATDRDASVPLPQDGDFAYLQNVDELQVYNGVAWVTYATVAQATGNFIGVTRGSTPVSTQLTGPAFVDIGASMNLGGTSGKSVWVTANWIGSMFQDVSATPSVVQLRLGISIDSGGVYSYKGANWQVCDPTTRRGLAGSAAWLDAGVPPGSVRVQLQGLLSSGPNVAIESGQMTALMMKTDGLT